MGKPAMLIGALALMVSMCAWADEDGYPGDAGELAALPLEGEPTRSRPEIPRPPVPTTQPGGAAITAPEEAIDFADYLTGDWRGLRKDLADRGVYLDLRATLETTKNLRGGLDTEDATGLYLLSSSLTFDTEKLAGWPGGTFFMTFMSKGGSSASERSVGDWQQLSNIDVGERTQISELYYEQFLLENEVRVKAGKIDAGGDFALAEYAADFVNSGMGFPVSATVLPTDPDPAVGVDVFVYPIEHWYIGAGLFDGSLQEGVRTGMRGPSTFWGSPADLFLIAETGATWTITETLPGRVRGGGWYHTGTFDSFAGDQRDGAHGWYMAVDQRLWRENPDREDDDQGIACFASYDWADPEFFEVEHHVSGGAIWVGAIPTRDQDVVGLGASAVRFSRDAGFEEDWETALESFYGVQLARWANLKFDLQYIMNPGGEDLRSALAVTLRLELTI